jgi:hypothetical protein
MGGRESLVGTRSGYSSMISDSVIREWRSMTICTPAERKIVSPQSYMVELLGGASKPLDLRHRAGFGDALR